MSEMVLITGGAGYIGSHAVYAFLDEDCPVVVVDNLSTGVRSCLPPQVPFEEGDVGDPSFIGAVLERYRPRTVVHFAGSIVVPESVENPGKYYRNNTAASIVLLQACVAHGVREFLFSSTAAVYGVPKTGMVTEDSPTQPASPYGWSKLMTERVLADMSAAHGLNYAVLRYFNVAGADPKGRTGQLTPQATHLIKVSCEVALGKRPALSIFGTDYPTPDGTCIRDFIHVSDLADAHVFILQHLRREQLNLLCNCGNGIGYSVRQVVAALEKLIGRSIAVTEAPRRAGDPPKVITNPKRLWGELGWRPRFSNLIDIVGDAYKWESRTKDPVKK